MWNANADLVQSVTNMQVSVRIRRPIVQCEWLPRVVITHGLVHPVLRPPFLHSPQQHFSTKKILYKISSLVDNLGSKAD